MRRISLWLVLATLCAFSGALPAEGQLPDQHAKCSYTAHKHNWLARQSIRYSSHGGNYVAAQVSRATILRMAQMRSCAKRAGEHRKYQAMRNVWRSRIGRWHFVRSIDAATPYGEWAIPWYIVSCESGGDYTQWNLGSTDPRRASGAYQIIKSTWYRHGGAQWASAAAYAPDYAQHIVAGRIWRSGGASQWDCS